MSDCLRRDAARNCVAFPRKRRDLSPAPRGVTGEHRLTGTPGRRQIRMTCSLAANESVGVQVRQRREEVTVKAGHGIGSLDRSQTPSMPLHTRAEKSWVASAFCSLNTL